MKNICDIKEINYFDKTYNCIAVNVEYKEPIIYKYINEKDFDKKGYYACFYLFNKNEIDEFNKNKFNNVKKENKNDSEKEPVIIYDLIADKDTCNNDLIKMFESQINNNTKNIYDVGNTYNHKLLTSLIETFSSDLSKKLGYNICLMFDDIIDVKEIKNNVNSVKNIKIDGYNAPYTEIDLKTISQKEKDAVYKNNYSK